MGVDAQSFLVSSTRFERCVLGSVWVFVWCFGRCLPGVLCQVLSLFGHGFAKGWRGGLVSVSGVINFRLETVIITTFLSAPVWLCGSLLKGARAFATTASFVAGSSLLCAC